MVNTVASNTIKTAKQAAVDIARQAALEPTEILKEVKTQASPIEIQTDKESPPFAQIQTSTSEGDIKQKGVQDSIKSERRLGALKNEIEDIRKQDLFNDLQAKISGGEHVPIQTFSELSLEQRQVLNALAESVKNKQKQAELQNSLSEVPTIHSKPSRRFGAGQKEEAQKQQTRVEKPVQQSV